MRPKNFMRHLKVDVMIALLPARPYSGGRGRGRGRILINHMYIQNSTHALHIYIHDAAAHRHKHNL